MTLPPPQAQSISRAAKDAGISPALSFRLALVIALLHACVETMGNPLRFDFQPSIVEKKAAALPPKKRPALTLSAKRCSVPPTIDGDLGDPSWEQAASIPAIGRKIPATSAKICFDDEALYFAVTCSEEKPQGESRESTSKAKNPHDGDEVWKGDCVEFWLEPLDAKYQFIAGRDGAALDAKGGNRFYNPAWTRAVKENDGFWTVEAAIPFAALELAGPVNRLGFNIGRNGTRFSPESWHALYGNTEFSDLSLSGVETVARKKEVEKNEPKGAKNLLISGDGLKIDMERSTLRPGERWLELSFELNPKIPLPQTLVKAELCKLDERKPLATNSARPTRDRGRLFVDMRSDELKHAELKLQLLENDNVKSAATILLSAESCQNPLPDDLKIPITLDLPEGVDQVKTWPVTFGVPFGAGQLWRSDKLRLVNEDGEAIPCQKEVTGRWGREGSIKWLRFDALVDVPPETIHVTLGGDNSKRNQETHPKVTLTETNDSDGARISVDAGKAIYALCGENSPISEIKMDGEVVATTKQAKGLYVIDQKGRLASARRDTVEIEAKGPIATCVRFEGKYITADGEELARHITRVECFADNAFANVTHTLILSRDSNEVWFKEIGWEFKTPAGSNTKAVFATSATDFRKVSELKLDANRQAVFMMQDEHFRFARGDNHFYVGGLDAEGNETVLEQGEECGDWALALGTDYGLQMGCRDAAKLHPKEFEIDGDVITLKLFSDRAGEQLDFSMPHLIKKWNLKNWFERMHANEKKKKGGWEKFIERTLNHKINAQGWARTHFIQINPLKTTPTVIEEAEKTGYLRSRRVYAHVDPEWIYKSDALGPLYPKNVKRFPVIEQYLKDAFDWWVKTDAAWGEWGFVDYACGPHLWHNHPPFPWMGRYVDHLYLCRKNWWNLYARSGSREIRDFMEKRTASKMDFLQTHHDTDSNVKGLYRVEYALSDLPYYWGRTNWMQLASSSGFYDYLTYHHLTGSRRAKDCLLMYADGVKRYWSEKRAKKCGRVIQLFLHLVQAYGLTWDPELKDLVEATADVFEDSRGDLLLSKDRPYHSSTYKTQVDVRALIQAWRITGSPRYRELADRVAQYWWNMYFHDDGPNTDYNKPTAVIGSYLHERTGDPVYAQALSVMTKREAAEYHPVDGEPKLPSKIRNAAFANIPFEIPPALDVIAKTNADKHQLCSWFAWEDYDIPASVIARKTDTETIDIQFNSSPRAELTIKPVNPGPGWAGLSQNSFKQTLGSWKTAFGDIRIPYDMRACAYQISFSKTGKHHLYANSPIPMVLHAPGSWSPIHPQNPPLRYYFKLPPKSEGAKITITGKARLFAPDDTLFRETNGNEEAVELPADKPGAWSLEALDKCVIELENAPPFFAAGQVDNLFIPKLKENEETDAKRDK